jgi:hypothetical protein
MRSAASPVLGVGSLAEMDGRGSISRLGGSETPSRRGRSRGLADLGTELTTGGSGHCRTVLRDALSAAVWLAKQAWSALAAALNL